MAISRNYNYEESTRPKLPRNIYDYVYQSSSESNSMFASSGGYSTITQVGSTMPDISVFTGATDSAAGTQGLVPAPQIIDKDKFLQGTGAWIDIPAFRWLQEFPSNSSNKTGLTINGDFNVSNTLSTQTLRVEGAAHFWSLLIDETKASGGQIYISPALFEVDYVNNSIAQYAVSSTPVQTILTQRSDWQTIFTENNVTHIYTKRAYMRCDDNEKRTRNECEIGDMMRCHTWNLDGVYAGQTYDNIGNKDYWTFVVNKSNGFVWYNTETKTESSSTPSDTTGWVKAFWIDLACQIKTSSGYINFGGYAEWSGDIIGNNQNQTTDVDLTELIKQAKKTWNGTTTTSDVSPTTGTPSDYTNTIVGDIYGAEDLVQSVNGSSSTRSATIASDNDITSFDLSQMQSALNKIANGTTDSFIDGMDEANMSSIILNETIDINEIPTEQDLDDAEGLSFNILGTTETATPLYSDEEAATMTSDAMSKSPMRAAASGSNSQAYWYFGYGDFNLEVGDQLAAFGHVFDENRMDAIVISAIDPIDTTLTAPAIAQYAGINEFGSQLNKFRTSVLAANGNYLQGSFKVVNNGALMDVNERINLMINDINTGLAKVGIFLDGDNSQIKLVGSVEIRQHDTNDYDTLTVWDSNSNKKVEITPKAITSLANISSIPMEQNYGLSQATYNNTWYSSNISAEMDVNVFAKNDWIYTLNNATNTFTISASLGTLATGDTLSIGGGNWTLRCPITFEGRNGTVDVNTRTGQQISSFMMYIKRNGSTVSSVDLKNNSRYSGYMPTGSNLTTDSIVIGIPTNIYASSQTISITSSGTYQPGTYTVEFVLGLKYGAVYTDSHAGRNNIVSNRSMTTQSLFTGSFNATITKSSPSFMQIGNNGLAFSMGANKLMYASDSAMKFNWKGSSWANTNSNGVGISFSDDYGMQIIKNVKSYSPSSHKFTIDAYVDVAILNFSGETTPTITLPQASTYGDGRILEIVTINNSGINLWQSYNTYQTNWPITFTSTSSTINQKRRTVEVRQYDSDNGHTSMSGLYWDGTFKFIASGSIWYEI